MSLYQRYSPHKDSRVAGLLLAAGAGRRFGAPKALVEVGGEALVSRAVRVLSEGGCSPVHVVVGASAEQVRAMLPPTVTAVTAQDWHTGMGASLRAGLESLRGANVDAVLVHLVDLPDVSAEQVSRIRALATPDVVARAGYRGRPGHPVLFGGNWIAEIAAAVSGDAGARTWLAGRSDVQLVECADLSTGMDVDTPSDLPP